MSEAESCHSICDNCGGANVAWATTDELWNKVSNDNKEAICPQCFVNMAQNKLNYESVIVVFDAKLIGR